ncbi:hypothetical protein QOT17_000068 [Balamuthia mandrillaris]
MFPSPIHRSRSQPTKCKAILKKCTKLKTKLHKQGEQQQQLPHHHRKPVTLLRNRLQINNLMTINPCLLLSLTMNHTPLPFFDVEVPGGTSSPSESTSSQAKSYEQSSSSSDPSSTSSSSDKGKELSDSNSSLRRSTRSRTPSTPYRYRPSICC